MEQQGIDLVLVHPGTNRLVYEQLADDYAAIEPPFAAALTAAFVRNKGYNVAIIDGNAENLSHVQVAERVKELNPRLVSIIVHGQQPSASSQLMSAVGETCKEIKGRINVPIVLRGIHPSSLPERTLREEACDYVARGEGFFTLQHLLEGNHRNKIPGLCFIDERNQFTSNPSDRLITTLDETLPDAAWDLLPMSKYRCHNWHAFDNLDNRKPYASLYTSLGCPSGCSFCCINAEFRAAMADNGPNPPNDRNEISLAASVDATKPNIRYWNPEIVLQHIDILVNQYGVRHLKFIDEMFVLNKRHVEGIADGIIRKGYDLNIWAYARVDTVNDIALLAKIKQAGINWLVLGIESGSQHVRAGAKKRYGNDAIFEAVQRVKDAGIYPMGNYIYGLPDDTPESMQQTIDLAKELKTPWYNGYAALAYPGAPLYMWAKNRGILLPGDKEVPGGWTAYSHHSYYSFPLPTDSCSNAEVLAFRDSAFNEYFEDQPYLDMLRSQFGQKVVDHVQQMTKHKIKRRILGNRDFEEYYQQDQS